MQLKRNLRMSILAGILFGLCITILEIHPVGDMICLSDLIMQLSGSKGRFALACSAPELLDFFFLQIPANAMILISGRKMYQHFCVASAYVFYRCEDRVSWYLRQCKDLFIEILAFEIMYLASIIVVCSVRYQLIWDGKGFVILVTQILLYASWIYFGSILVNILSLSFGSSTGYMIFIIVESVFISILCILYPLPNSPLKTIFLNIDPISHLVLGWQTSHIIGDFGKSDNVSISCMVSILYETLALICIILFGMKKTLHQEIIVNNHETDN